MNKLWKCTLKIHRGSFEDLPKNWQGAYVNFYTGTPSYEGACKKAISMAQTMGMVVIEQTKPKLFQINPEEWWDEYVVTNHAQYSDVFPSREEIFEIVERGLIFHGPFAGWKKNEAG